MHEHFSPEQERVFRPVPREIQPKVFVGEILPSLKPRALPEEQQLQLLLLQLNNFQTETNPVFVFVEEKKEEPSDPVERTWEMLGELCFDAAATLCEGAYTLYRFWKPKPERRAFV